MRFVSKKCLLLLIFIILLLAITLKKLKLSHTYLNIMFGSILIILLAYEIITEIGENYEDKEENSYVLNLVKKLSDAHPDIKRIAPKLKFFEGKKSYTINKTYVFICLKDEKGRLYQQNQLVLVITHEIAHALCDEIGHTDKFQQILDDLLKAVEKAGLYDPRIPHIPDYCEY